MAGTVIGHHLAHVLEQLLPVLGLVHVDEVDDDDAAHVAQTQLACDLVGGTQVHLEGVALLVGRRLRAVARVDVDDVQCLCMFDDYICARFEGDGLAERRLDLSRDVEMVEDGNLPVISLYDVLALGGDKGDVFGYLLVCLGIVDMDALECRAEHVAQHADDTALLLEYQCRSGGLHRFGHSVFPAMQQGLELVVQLAHAFAFGRRADDDAEILGLDAVDELAQAQLFLGRRDFL